MAQVDLVDGVTEIGDPVDIGGLIQRRVENENDRPPARRSDVIAWSAMDVIARFAADQPIAKP